MTDHMKAAIEAGTVAMVQEASAQEGMPSWLDEDDVTPDELSDVQTRFKCGLDAALPHIRAMIAEEVELSDYDTGTHLGYDDRMRSSHREGVSDAARIVRGEDT